MASFNEERLKKVFCSGKLSILEVIYVNVYIEMKEGFGLEACLTFYRRVCFLGVEVHSSIHSHHEVDSFT